MRFLGRPGFLLILILMSGARLCAQELYVSPTGDDTHSGTIKLPLRTPEAALARIKSLKQSKIRIYLRRGTYYLDKTIIITPAIIAGKNVTIESFQNEKVVLSAGKKLDLKWEKHAGNVWKAPVKDASFEMLFADGRQLPMARYPNYDSTARFFNGTASDAIAPERVAKWENPAGGYVHALHQSEWGSFHYRIKGIKNGEPELEGGWQNNRPSPLHRTHRFVENIFEELDAPGEWYLDQASQMLYYYPLPGTSPAQSVFEASNLDHIIELRGTSGDPVRNVTWQGIRFEHTRRTIMKHYEPLVRSDWMIYRGGAAVLEGTEKCFIRDSEFTNLGGNAVMFTGYNVGSGVTGSHIFNIGSSAICFIGDSSAVRSPAFGYENFVPYEKMDKTPGSKNNRYPLKCIAADNLIHHIGRIEKQCTGVEIELAAEIHVNHNTIYHVPRAGINIGDGAWGGHLLENNDVFETVLETGDHGAFNSWGRDRFWHPNRKTMDSLVAAHPELILLDAQKTVVIRNNRFRCDHGWDVDLDDGSSNYHIYNNVFLSGGLKFREGFHRIAENNILLNNSFHPHVWFANSGDVFRRNIVMRPYFPIVVKDWGKEVDYNLFPDEAALKSAQANGTDLHSIAGDPGFADAKNGNYQVKDSGPAQAIGFKNFPMDQFGTRKENLKKLAPDVEKPVLLNAELEKKMQEMTWLGIKIRNVQGLGDRSAFGLPDEKGVIIVAIPESSILAKSGLQANDVIILANSEKADNVVRLEAIRQQINWTGQMDVQVLRNQQPVNIRLNLK